MGMFELGEQAMMRTDDGHKENAAKNEATANTRSQSMALESRPVKQMEQNIAIEPNGRKPGMFRVSNQYDYISLDRFEPRWELQENGTTIAQGELEPMPVLPGQSVKMSLPLDDTHYKTTACYELILSFQPIVRSLWAPAEQFVSSGKLRIQ